MTNTADANEIRTVRQSQSEYSEICLPNSTNMLGTMLGGHVMHLVDLCGAIAAIRHARAAVVKLWGENLRTGEVRHTSSAYLTFVALDENGTRIVLPPIAPETPEEQRRYDEAAERRAYRLAFKAKAKENL